MFQHFYWNFRGSCLQNNSDTVSHDFECGEENNDWEDKGANRIYNAPFRFEIDNDWCNNNSYGLNNVSYDVNKGGSDIHIFRLRGSNWGFVMVIMMMVVFMMVVSMMVMFMIVLVIVMMMIMLAKFWMMVFLCMIKIQIRNRLNNLCVININLWKRFFFVVNFQ